MTVCAAIICICVSIRCGGNMPERIVVLSTQGASSGLAEIQKRYRVLSVLPPRLVVVELDDTEMQAVRRLPSTQAIIARPTEAIPSLLEPNEQLFVEAWQQRQLFQNKQRPGEGQPWDAEGFQPPDFPKRR
jgi:hypothetical protein